MRVAMASTQRLHHHLYAPPPPPAPSPLLPQLVGVASCSTRRSAHPLLVSKTSSSFRPCSHGPVPWWISFRRGMPVDLFVNRPVRCQSGAQSLASTTHSHEKVVPDASAQATYPPMWISRSFLKASQMRQRRQRAWPHLTTDFPSRL